MNVLSCLSLIGERNNFDKYIKYIKGFYLNPEATTLLKDIEDYYRDDSVDTIDWDEFKDWFHIRRHPTFNPTQKKMYSHLIDTIKGKDPDDDSVLRVYELNTADIITSLMREVEDGNTKALTEAFDIIDEYLTDNIHSAEDYMVDMDVTKLVDAVIKGDGIEWRLNHLNTSVGQIHSSDFIVVGKRPETGGTTFITSEFTYMLSQLPDGKNAIIFNNEEGGEKIGLRIIQSALNVTSHEIAADPTKIQIDFKDYLDGRRIYICDAPGMNTKDIDRILKEHPDCWLIGLNVLDKVGGFYRKDDVARYRSLAEWARNIAKKYGVVIAIAQADASAEGQQYLDQTQLYGSKTGVQGECDILIMIGRIVDEKDRRYFSIAKNKKPTTGLMEIDKRHAKFSAHFDEVRGRFTSR